MNYTKNNKSYGDIKAVATDIFNWLYNNLVNANFATGNAEISMVALQNKAAEYGIDLFNKGDM